MSEPYDSVHDDIAKEGADAPSSEPTAVESVELDVDEKKVEAWDEVKSDYQVEPGGKPVPNSMAPTDYEPIDEDEDDEQ